MLQYLHKASHRVLISGGAGFIGANLAAHLLATTDVHVTVYDNLSGDGSEANLAWLKQQAAPGRLHFVRGDVRNSVAISEAVGQADEVYHLAARCPQGVETRGEFDVNVTGTLNVLDAARRSAKTPMVLFASLSEDYGQLRTVPVEQLGEGFRTGGSTTPDFHAAYECSVATAEGFVSEYAGQHGLNAVVMRLDTVAGPRQFGGDPHAWVSNHVRAVLCGAPVRVMGNGSQVHDVLHVSDLVEAIAAARAYLGVTAGKVYNLGGGTSHAVSVTEMIQMIERVTYRKAHVEHAAARLGQRSYRAADTWRFMADTGWMVKRSLEQTVRDVAQFWCANESRRVDQMPGFAPTLIRAA